MSQVIVALDVPSARAAEGLLRALGPEPVFVKVGLELFTREGPEALKTLRRAAGGELRIFLDLKLHDIPNTVAGAVSAAASLEVDLLTLHAAGGPRMMEAAARAAAGSPMALLAVTVLTSLEAREGEVRRLATAAAESGVDGVVCSPHEARELRALLGPEAPIVTPGIRPSGTPTHDQTRVATPRAAVEAGASHLVVGRAISEALDPKAMLTAIRAEVAEALPLTGTGWAPVRPGGEGP
jgi:orotidine-5'-phosphate decarboxylase